MTRRPITELSVDAAYRRLQDDRHQRFEAAMNSGAPIVDNASDRLRHLGELEGDLCPGCGDRIPGDEDRCGECRYCPVCEGAGGWQQHDGLIVECPRGCMTGERVA